MAEGMPLLSGPLPPESNDGATSHCRKCGKDFGLFTRPRRCNHCGYHYCSSCSDYQALMPRNTSGSDSGYSGYDPMPVCACCIELLQITASGKSKLRSLPMTKLKKYINAYNLQIKGAVEKDDLIDVIVNARGLNGCLLPENEAYYRAHLVPTSKTPSSGSSAGNTARSFFSRAFGDSSQSHWHSQSSAPPPRPQPQRTRSQSHPEFPRPDLDPNDQRPRPPRRPTPQNQQRQPRWAPSGGPRYPSSPHPQGAPGRAYPSPPPTGRGGPNPYGSYSYGSRSASHSHVPRTDTRSQPPPPPPRPASTAAPERERIPTLDELLTMDEEGVARLSVHVLKDVLFHNHVPARQVLEKAELVSKVLSLIDQEKRERERKREDERREEEEYIARQQVLREQLRAQKEKEEAEKREKEERERSAGYGSNATLDRDGDTLKKDETKKPGEESKPLPPKAQAMAAALERTGLCVICQDEEANIAIVDCGHLAMCRACADSIMSTTRECPLCRTRIVTEARLLRIFKP